MSTIEHIIAPEELMAYLDGELPPERAASVGAHLSDCASCQSLAADLRGVSDELRAWVVEPAPQTLSRPVVRHVAPHSVYRVFASWSPGLRQAAAAAGVVVALGAVFWVAQFSTGRFSVAGPPNQEPSRDVAVSAGRIGSGAAGTAAASPVASSDRRLMARTAPSSAEATQPSRQDVRSAKIIRTSTLAVVVADVSSVRSAVDRILQTVGGFIGHIQVSGEADAGWLRATLRVPAARLDETVAALRSLGRVVDESQSGDDVTDQVRDLEVRLANSRTTEKRLNDILRNRTADLSDVLQVEREIARVREEIERMDAERQNLEHRVAYATITLQVNQQRQASLNLGPLPLSTKFRNAIVDGLRDAFESVLGLMLWLLRIGPTLLLWVIVLWWPVRFAIRRGRAWTAPAQ